MKLLERDVQKMILDYLLIKGVYVWRNQTQGTFDEKKKNWRNNQAKKGVSDILGILKDGRFLAIEVKRTGIKKGSDDQEAFLQDIRERGGVAFVADSVTEAIQQLEGLI